MKQIINSVINFFTLGNIIKLIATAFCAYWAYRWGCMGFLPVMIGVIIWTK